MKSRLWTKPDEIKAPYRVQPFAHVRGLETEYASQHLISELHNNHPSTRSFAVRAILDQMQWSKAQNEAGEKIIPERCGELRSQVKKELRRRGLGRSE